MVGLELFFCRDVFFVIVGLGVEFLVFFKIDFDFEIKKNRFVFYIGFVF